MKKILVYSVVAVVLGLTLILVPLITRVGMRRSFSQQLEELEGTHGSDAPMYSTSDVRILAFSFVIALVVYLLFRRRTSRHDYRWGRPFSY